MGAEINASGAQGTFGSLRSAEVEAGLGVGIDGGFESKAEALQETVEAEDARSWPVREGKAGAIHREVRSHIRDELNGEPMERAVESPKPGRHGRGFIDGLTEFVSKLLDELGTNKGPVSPGIEQGEFRVRQGAETAPESHGKPPGLPLDIQADLGASRAPGMGPSRIDPVKHALPLD